MDVTRDERVLDSLPDLRVEFPADSQLFASLDFLRGDKAEMVAVVGQMRHDLHLDIGNTTPSDIAKYGAFLSIVDVEREVRREEHEGLRVKKGIPSILRIGTVSLLSANTTFDFANVRMCSYWPTVFLIDGQILKARM